MPRRIEFKKQHKPIGFGDAYDPRSVEGHRNSMIARTETRQFNRLLKERQAEREADKPLHEKLWEWIRSSIRHYR